jgi:hypothetical protein
MTQFKIVWVQCGSCLRKVVSIRVVFVSATISSNVLTKLYDMDIR